MNTPIKNLDPRVLKKRKNDAIENCLLSPMLDDDEKECLKQWQIRNCINSKYYHINFLLKELDHNIHFIPNEDDLNELEQYFNRDKGSSTFHKLWIAEYFEKREIKKLKYKFDN